MNKKIRITIYVFFRNRAHFYRSVYILNEIVGKGKLNWTMRGKPYKQIGNIEELKTQIWIFNPEIKESDLLDLYLI